MLREKLVKYVYALVTFSTLVCSQVQHYDLLGDEV